MKFTKLFLALGALAAWSFSAQAQILVNSGVNPTITFGAAPVLPVNQWAWHTNLAADGAGTFGNAAAVTAAMANLNVSVFNNAYNVLPTTTAYGTSRFVRHNTSAGRICFQATGVAANVLRAALRNNSAGTFTTLQITYDNDNLGGYPGSESTEVPGLMAYYSATGLPGSWTGIPAFSGAIGAGSKSATLFGLSWAPGADMYLVWVDDNTATNPDGTNTIDNVVFDAGSGPPPPIAIAITSPTNNQQVAQYANLNVTTTSAGSITSVDFFVDGTLVATDPTPPYGGLVPVTASIGFHTLIAVATNTTTMTGAESAPITVEVLMNTPPTIALTNSYSGANTGLTFLVGSPITVQASYTDDDTITNIEWRVDDVLYLTNRINNTQIYINPTVGMHTFKGIARDTLGQTNFAELTFTITNPPSPQYTVLQPNGDTWFYHTNTGAAPLVQGINEWFNFDYVADDINGWGSGPAELGNGDTGDGYPEQTRIDIGLGQPRYMTVYFRKYFTVADPSLYPNIVLRGLTDDGSVVYLNGNPVWTNNITVTNDPIGIGYTNAANGAVSETAYQVFNLDNVGLTHLIPGLNSIAVEVHQQNTNSSDLSFDLMIWGETAGTPTVVITSPTNTQSFAQCANIVINATASTFVNSVEFYVDGGYVGEDTTRPYSWTNSSLSVGPHVIKAVATDIFSNSGESEVNITVAANVPPVVTFTNSYSGANTGLVFLVGSPITCQFSVSDPDSALTSVEFLVNNMVILTTNVAYGTLTVGDALAGNSTFTIRATDNCLGVGSASRDFIINNPPSTLIVVSNGSSWKYFNTSAAPLADLEADEWYVGSYDDTSWLSGFAEIGGGDKVLPPTAATVPERTLLDIGPAGARYTAAYFRHQFTVSNPLDYGALSVLSMHDDGAVVYLNGVIVATFNMPAGPYAYGTLASGAVAGDGSLYYRSNITASLIAGVNTLAVEVHQNAIDSSDLSFDLMLHAGGPPLTIVLDTVLDTATVSWGATGYVLQQSGTIASPTVWTDVPGNPSSPVVINNVSAQGIKFFQLRQGP